MATTTVTTKPVSGVNNNSFLNWYTKKFGAVNPTGWETEAKKIAAGIIDPQEAAIQRAIEAQQTQAESFRQGGIGVQKALGELYAPGAGQIQQAYADAGNRIAGYAQGLTGEVGAQAQTAAEQAAAGLAKIGAPGGVPTVSGQAMNTANYLGGYLPATDLAREAADQMAMQTGLGQSAQAAIAQQTLQQMGANQAEIASLRNQGIDIEKTRPAEIAKALLQVRGQWQEDVSTAFNVWKADQDRIQQNFVNQLNKKKDEREAAAFKLQVQQYQRATGKDSWAIAKQLSDSTGWVWTVKNGTPVQTNTRTVTWRKNQATANAAKVANRIRQQNANTQQNKAAQQADKTKGTGGLTPNQVVIRENTWMGGMAKAVDKIVGAQKTTNPITNKVTLRPAHMPPKKADLVRKIYNSVGPSLVGRIPRWTPAYLKSLIYAYISTLPNAWWDPKTYAVKKK